MVVFFFDAASSFKLILVFSTWRILLEMGFHARSHSFAIVDMYYGRIDAMGDVIRWPPGARS